MKRTCNICNRELNGLYMDVDKKLIYYPCEHCKSVFIINSKTDSQLHEGLLHKNPCFPKGYLKSVLNMTPIMKASIILDRCEEEGICVKNWLEIGESSEYSNVTDLQTFAKEKGFQMSYFDIDADMPDERKIQAISNADIISCTDILNQIDNPKEFLAMIYKFSKQNSILAIEVPRYPSMYFLFMPYDEQSMIARNQLFSEESLIYLFKDKFCIIEKWEYGNSYEKLIQNILGEKENRQEISYQKFLLLGRHIQETLNTEGLADRMLIITKKRSKK